MLKKEWIKQGFIDEPVAEGTDLKAEIREMCKEKDVWLRHVSYCRQTRLYFVLI